MADSNPQLAADILNAGGRMVPSAFDAKFNLWLKNNGREVTRMFGGNKQKAQQLAATLIWCVNRTPKLMECDFVSLTGAFLQCAALDMFPGPFQEAAIVPLNNKKTGKTEANFWPQYQGIAKKIYQSGFVRKIQCEVVWAGDYFKYNRGSDSRLEHEPIENEAERGERIGVYCIITNRWGGEEITYRSATQIKRIKSSAAGGGSSESPWNSKDPDRVDWMWKKSVLKQAAKMLPKTPDLAMALDADNKVENPELHVPSANIIPEPRITSTPVADEPEQEPEAESHMRQIAGRGSEEIEMPKRAPVSNSVVASVPKAEGKSNLELAKEKAERLRKQQDENL